MKKLFTMDIKDYDECWKRSKRPSAQGIIEKDGKLALINNIKYDYYAFPGGGIGESVWIKRETRVLELVIAEKEGSV